MYLRSFLLVAAATHAGADLTADVEKVIKPIVDQMAVKYKCAISAAVFKDHPTKGFKASAAGGVIDGGGKGTSGTQTLVSDPFVWGSVTKVLTGTGILRLVSKGLIKLNDTIPQYIDPFMKQMKLKNPSQNFSSLADLWGPETAKVTIEDLLGMKSGIPDYDTASPTGRQPTDFLRKTVYEHPTDDFIPAALLNLPWARTGHLLFTPGACDREKYGNCYTSTNFVLLGMVLAHHAGADNWDTFDQSTILTDVSGDFSAPFKFATHGPPSKWTNVRGYDTTNYNNQTKPHEVTDDSGVFSGWTAGDLVGIPSNLARFIYDVYASPYKLVSKEYVDLMYNTSGPTGYGLATFNLTRKTGQHGPDGVAMGHLGATYGFQSIVAYNPAMDFSLAIATNIERDEQDQPADTMCSIFNEVRALIRGIPAPRCTFTTGYYSSGCKCTEDKMGSAVVV